MQRFLPSSDCLLRSDADAAHALETTGVATPYSDPAFRPPRLYAAFLLEAHARGLIEWEVNLPSRVGVFFVYKKNGQLRLICDTRVCNEYFCDAPHVQLPTASALASIEAETGETLYFSAGDVQDFF